MPAKICLYLEFRHFCGGILFRRVGTGLLASYENQKDTLTELGIPFVEAWEDSCDILQINTPWIKSVYLMKKARRQGKKVIVWAHVTMEDAIQVFRFMPLLAPLFRRYLTYAYGLADCVFCPSEYTKSLLTAYGIAPAKMTVLSNGVNTQRFQRDAEKGATFRREYDLDKPTIGTVGLVIPRKGIDTFLELARRFPQYQFLWIGKIYSSLLVKPLPKTLPSNVRFTGYVDDVVAALSALDVFLFPSYEENQGMSILEAAAIGLPIIVRDLPAYQGWLQHGENCLKAGELSEFEQHLRVLMSNEACKNKIEQGAAALARNESLPVISQRTQEAYGKILAG